MSVPKFELEVGEEFDPSLGVTASDNEDGNITSNVVIKDNNVDTSKPGTYTVTYEVTDKDGNKTIEVIEVIVSAKAETLPETVPETLPETGGMNMVYLLILGILTIACGVKFIFGRSENKNNI